MGSGDTVARWSYHVPLYGDFVMVAQWNRADQYIFALWFLSFFLSFYSARNARIASAVLATAIPSVCLSVARRYCVKTMARSTVQFAPLDSKMCLVL